jgi:hypothetical protein
MKTGFRKIASGRSSNHMKFFYGLLIGIALIVLTGGFVVLDSHAQASLPEQVSPTPTSLETVSSDPDPARPLYHKKALVFKRTMDETEFASIRTSELSPGYMALSSIPLSVVAPQVSIRMPQFLNSSTLSNYQALSTLGTQQYYNNLGVQQYLTGLSNQQYTDHVMNEIYWNNVDTQQYLNNFNLSNQQFTMDYNFNNSMQFLNNYNNTLSNQQHLNNFNNNFNTFSNPTYNFQPMRQMYTPPMQFYSPPSSFGWP